jgi:hypothetical protein
MVSAANSLCTVGSDGSENRKALGEGIGVSPSPPGLASQDCTSVSEHARNMVAASQVTRAARSATRERADFIHIRFPDGSCGASLFVPRDGRNRYGSPAH